MNDRAVDKDVRGPIPTTPASRPRPAAASGDAAGAASARGTRFASVSEVSCIEPPAERFAGKNDWWVYVLAIGGIALCFVLLLLAGASVPFALSCLIVPALFAVPPLVRNWVDLYADRFVVAFGFRTVTVHIPNVAGVEEVRRKLGAPTANGNACVRVELCDPAADTAAPCGELFVALRDNARFVETLTERRERLRHFR